MTLSRDQFNSLIFEMSMANVIVEKKEYAKEDVKKILLKAQQEQYQFLCVKIDTSEKKTTNLFLKEGFDLVDTQVMYRLPLNKTSEQEDSCAVRLFLDYDIKNIMEIARTSFQLDQFHGNPLLSTEKCDLYYEQWAKNLCEGLADDVFIIEKENQTVGFLSLKYHGREATVGLAAIDPRYHNEGLFTALLSGTICRLKGTGYEVLYYGTQLANAPILKTMTKFCGVPLYSKYVLHKMLG